MEGGALGKIEVNFDPGLVAMLRETRYFQLATGDLPSAIPDLALQVGVLDQARSIQPCLLMFQPAEVSAEGGVTYKKKKNLPLQSLDQYLGQPLSMLAL